MNRSHFEDLPCEVFELICTYLNHFDIAKLEQTSQKNRSAILELSIWRKAAISLIRNCDLPDVQDALMYMKENKITCPKFCKILIGVTVHATKIVDDLGGSMNCNKITHSDKTSSDLDDEDSDVDDEERSNDFDEESSYEWTGMDWNTRLGLTESSDDDDDFLLQLIILGLKAENRKLRVKNILECYKKAIIKSGNEVESKMCDEETSLDVMNHINEFKSTCFFGN